MQRFCVLFEDNNFWSLNDGIFYIEKLFSLHICKAAFGYLFFSVNFERLGKPSLRRVEKIPPLSSWSNADVSPRVGIKRIKRVLRGSVCLRETRSRMQAENCEKKKMTWCKSEDCKKHKCAEAKGRKIEMLLSSLFFLLPLFFFSLRILRDSRTRWWQSSFRSSETKEREKKKKTNRIHTIIFSYDRKIFVHPPPSYDTTNFALVGELINILHTRVNYWAVSSEDITLWM